MNSKFQRPQLFYKPPSFHQKKAWTLTLAIRNFVNTRCLKCYKQGMLQIFSKEQRKTGEEEKSRGAVERIPEWLKSSRRTVEKRSESQGSYVCLLLASVPWKNRQWGSKLSHLSASILYRDKRVCKVVQSCPTLCDPMDCSLPGFSVHGIFQARILEWVAISFSRGSSLPRDQTWVSSIADWRFTIWATREAHHILKTIIIIPKAQNLTMLLRIIKNYTMKRI